MKEQSKKQNKRIFTYISVLSYWVDVYLEPCHTRHVYIGSKRHGSETEHPHNSGKGTTMCSSLSPRALQLLHCDAVNIHDSFATVCQLDQVNAASLRSLCLRTRQHDLDLEELRHASDALADLAAGRWSLAVW